MSQEAFLERVVGCLEAAGIPYMLTGSLVSSAQGVPRASHDVDIVISVSAGDAGRVVGALAVPGMYLDANAVADALRRRTSFNLIDTRSGDKADFWILHDEPYDRERFARRVTMEAFGLRLVTSTPEDTILMKLKWSLLSGGSAKQLDDAAGVYEFQGDVLDQAYLDRWAEALGVSASLREVRERVADDG